MTHSQTSSRRIPPFLGWLGTLCTIMILCALFTWPDGKTPQRATASTPLSFEQVVEQMRQNQERPKPTTQPAILHHSQAGAELARATHTLRDYLIRYNEFPTGNNAEITKLLMGANPQGIKFIVPGEVPIDDAGQLIDYWQTPYFFHQLAGRRMEVRSAGPDRELWTADDLVLFPK